MIQKVSFISKNNQTNNQTYKKKMHQRNIQNQNYNISLFKKISKTYYPSDLIDIIYF